MSVSVNQLSTRSTRKMQNNKAHILYVDDEPSNLNAFKSAFRFDYKIITASSPQEAFPLLKKHKVEVIIADQRMPEMTGVEFLTKAREDYPDPIRIILTAYSDLEAVVQAINEGQVFRYISKPWDEQEFKMNIEIAVKLYRINQENQRLLKEQQKMLDFVRIAAHDLKEPVRTIGSFMKLLKRDFGQELNGTGNEYVNFAIDASERMSMMITEILNNPSARLKRLEIVDVDLNVLMENLLGDLQQLIQDKQATIYFDQLPKIQSSPLALTQILQNLITNAIKYCDRKPEIHISCDVKEVSYFFKVADNGIGVPAKHADRIFKVFERLHTNEDKYSGKGIGLATCKRMIDNLGGKIWLRSTVGEGSTFHFTLPIDKDIIC